MDTYTENFLREILENSDLADQLREERQAYGAFTGESLRSFVHTYLYLYLESNLIFVEWDVAASEVNTLLEPQPAQEFYGEWLLAVTLLIVLCLVY